MSFSSTQQLLFQQIKAQIPSHVSLVDEVADILNISTDSAYRRIRAEKPIDIEELKKLALHFKLSIDQLLHMEKASILFADRSIFANVSFHFDLYLQSLVQDLTFMNSFERKSLYYLNKDLPIFHHFSIPELAAFKCFFWMRSIVNDPLFMRESFVLDKYYPHFIEMGKKISSLYSQIPSVEIWNEESINSTLRQIEYYRKTKVFSSKNDVAAIYDGLHRVVNEIENQAETGTKSAIGNPVVKGADYQVFFNEFILGDNTILVELNEKRMAFLNHGVINYLMTQNEQFCTFTYDHFQNLMKRSTPISRSNEKERTRFFNRIREKIAARRLAVAS